MLETPEYPGTALPALWSLNLPLGSRVVPTIISWETASESSTNVVVKRTVEKEDKAPVIMDNARTTTLKSPAPRSLNYGFLNMLQNLSVEATPANAELFHLCKSNHD
jgi:hypothetical protein